MDVCSVLGGLTVFAKGRIPRHRHRRPRKDVNVSGESVRMSASVSVSVSASWNASITRQHAIVSHCKHVLYM